MLSYAMMIILIVAVPVAAGIAYAVWMSHRLGAPPRVERSIDADDGEPAPSLDFWEHRRAR